MTSISLKKILLISTLSLSCFSMIPAVSFASDSITGELENKSLISPPLLPAEEVIDIASQNAATPVAQKKFEIKPTPALQTTENESAITPQTKTKTEPYYILGFIPWGNIEVTADDLEAGNHVQNLVTENKTGNATLPNVSDKSLTIPTLLPSSHPHILTDSLVDNLISHSQVNKQDDAVSQDIDSLSYSRVMGVEYVKYNWLPNEEENLGVFRTINGNSVIVFASLNYFIKNPNKNKKSKTELMYHGKFLVDQIKSRVLAGQNLDLVYVTDAEGKEVYRKK